MNRIAAALVLLVLLFATRPVQAACSFPGVGSCLSLDNGTMLPTANNGVLVTNGSGVPSIGTAAQAQPVLGSALLPHVASNAALKALAGGSVATVMRDGYATAGDGGAAMYNWSGSNCPLNAGVGDNGLQVQPNSGGGCWLADFGSGAPSVKVWGAVGDGSTNDATALNASFSSGVPVVRLPTAKFHSNSALTAQVSIVADGLSNAAYFNGAQGPNGAYLECANSVSTCLTVSTPASTNTGQGGLVAKGFAVGFAGTPGAGSSGLTVSSTYEVLVRDVQVFNAVNGFKVLNSGTGYGLSARFDNVATCQITGVHLLIDGEPEVRVFGASRFGCNGDTSDTAGGAYIQIQNTVGSAGPNTLYVEHSQFNTGNASALVTCGLSFIGITSTQLEWTFVGNHMENANYVMCSDSGTTRINQLNFVGNEFDSRGSFDAFNLNAATGIEHWHLTGNIFKAWPSFTLAPVNSFQDFTANGNQFGNGIFSLTGITGCNALFESNTYFGLTINGAFGQGKFTGSNQTNAVTNNASTAVELSFPSSSGGKEWTLFTPGLTFGGGNTGMTFSTQWGRYKVVGSLVTVQMHLALSAVGSSTGAALVTGLPFTLNAPHGQAGSGTVPSFYTGFSGLSGVLVLSPASGTTTINVDQTSATGITAITNAAFTASTVVQAEFSYPIN